MIANDRQFQHTRKMLAELKHLLASTRAGTAGDEGFRELQAEGLESQIQDLHGEIEEYEQLRTGTTRTIRAASLAELADALIKARVARGWTQADLAAALGVAEQQIQRYEANRYAAASLARLCDIADALHVTVEETLTLQAS